MTATPAPAAPPKLLPALGGWVLFLTIETVTQVTFKYAGGGLDGSAGFWPLVIHAAATPLVWIAFALYFCGFLVWLTILKDIDLGRGFPMTATTYLATLTAGVVLFHEPISPLRLLGVAAIIAGVMLLASDENSAKGVVPPIGPVHG